MTLGLGRGILGGKFRTLTPLPPLSDFFLKKRFISDKVPPRPKLSRE